MSFRPPFFIQKIESAWFWVLGYVCLLVSRLISFSLFTETSNREQAAEAEDRHSGESEWQLLYKLNETGAEPDSAHQTVGHIVMITIAIMIASHMTSSLTYDSWVMLTSHELTCTNLAVYLRITVATDWPSVICWDKLTCITVKDWAFGMC